MSHQSSNSDSLKSNANAAYESLSNTLAPPKDEAGHEPDQDRSNYKKDAHGNTVKKGDLKDKLNEAAVGGPKEPEPTILEKVSSYVPGVSQLQDLTKDQEKPARVVEQPGPPNRPDHDVQVEQFLRKQYHSKSGDGMPDPDAKD